MKWNLDKWCTFSNQWLFNGLITDIYFLLFEILVKNYEDKLSNHHRSTFDSEAGLCATELGIQNETESCCLVLWVDILGLVSFAVVYLVGTLCVEAWGIRYTFFERNERGFPCTCVCIFYIAWVRKKCKSLSPFYYNYNSVC